MVLLWLILTIIQGIRTFNVDTENPIIFNIPLNVSRTAYFGYSVAIRPHAFSYFNVAWVLQVSAPRVNISGVNAVEPGGIFRCHSSGICSFSVLDKTGNIMFQASDKSSRFQDLKDNAWVGVAMDVHYDTDREVSVVCGHRFGYQAKGAPLGIRKTNYLIIGVCYVEDLAMYGNITKLTPLRNEDRAYYLLKMNEADYDWGLGLAGMSARFVRGSLLLGAPTVYHTTGTVASYPSNLRDPSVPKLPVLGDFFAYNGYSVGSGKFFGDGIEWLLMGAPRSTDLRGKVIPFIIQNPGKDATIKILHSAVLIGKSYGEYFGAALAVADVNGDGLDDLFVGAPMFSRRSTDQGRLYTFMGQRNGGFKEGEVYEGTAARGRLGQCVTSIGDIDLDGFADIAVGAPYESGAGAIYIFRGGPRGIRHPPAQKILASTISPSLRGFGISISPAVDVDGDHYKEIAVGAFLSDQAVLLRSRPVIVFPLKIEHPKFLDRKLDLFNVTMCVSHTGKFPPSTVGVVLFAVVDENMGRANFRRRSRNNWITLEETLTFSKPLCKNYTIILDRSRLNGTFEEEIEISLTAELSLKPSLGAGNTRNLWTPLLPVLNPDVYQAKTIVKVPFAGECGEDNECKSKLRIKCSFATSNGRQPNSLRLGSSDILSIVTSVVNLGEPARATRLTLNVSGNLLPDLRTRNALCASELEKVICNFETLSEHAEERVEFDISIDSWSLAEAKTLVFSAHVATDSSDDLVDNECSLTVNLESDARLSLKPSPPVSLAVPHSLSAINNTHTYNVEKFGASPLRGAVFEISYPSTYYGIPFSRYIPPPVTNEVDINEDELQNAESLVQLTNSNDSTLYLNCTCDGVVCTTVVIPMQSTSFSYDVPITLDVKALEPFLNHTKIIHFATNATLTTTDGFGERLSVNMSASTSVVITPASPPVDMRIIILAVLIGVLLFAVIFSVLAKSGFFRRKKKEAIEAAIAEDFIKERFSANPRKSSDDAISFKTLGPDYDNTL